MKYFYCQKLKKAVLALNIVLAAGGASAAYAAPLHDASSNILGAAKDKSAGGKKTGGGAESAGKAQKAEPDKQRDAPKLPSEPHKNGADKALWEGGLRAYAVKASFSGGSAVRAYKAAHLPRRSHLGAAKRAEILGGARAKRAENFNSGLYPQAEIVSYRPSLITGQRPYSSLIHKLALKYNMPEDLIHAVVHTESNYNYRLRGGVGEIGLMQIRPETARMLGYTGAARGLYEPAVNLEYGTRYLALARYLSGGSLCGTVLKYNAGHGAKHMNPVSYRYCRNVKSYLYTVGYRY